MTKRVPRLAARELLLQMQDLGVSPQPAKLPRELRVRSGGPYFGTWSGEPWPRVVSIQSGQNLGGAGGDNTCGGGNPLSELINYARNAMP